MEVLTSGNGNSFIGILNKTDIIIENTCKDYYDDKKKLIANLKKDKKNLSLTVNSFLLKQKLYGLSDAEMNIFNIIKVLK